MKNKFISYILITSFLLLNLNLAVLASPEADSMTSDGGAKFKGSATYNYTKFGDKNLDYIDKENMAPKVTYKELDLKDYPIIRTDRNKNSKRIVHTGKYHYKNEKMLRVRPVQKIKTKNSSVYIADGDDKVRKGVVYPLVGTELEFETLDDIVSKGKVIVPKGSIIKGSVGEVSSKAMGGAPAEIRVDKFKATGTDDKVFNLTGQVEGSGLSLSLWIGLIELGSTPFVYGFAAPLLRFLPGGQATISPKKEYVLYYYDES